MSQANRTVSTFRLMDQDSNIEAKDSVVFEVKDFIYEGGDQEAIQEIIMEFDVKSEIEEHNNKRAKYFDKAALSRHGREVQLQPVKLKDLQWQVS